jgi:hypothetical protein
VYALNDEVVTKAPVLTVVALPVSTTIINWLPLPFLKVIVLRLTDAVYIALEADVCNAVMDDVTLEVKLLMLELNALTLLVKALKLEVILLVNEFILELNANILALNAFILLI